MGNPTSYLGNTLTWQGKQLSAVTASGQSITYSYDENGLRTQKTVNGTTTNYYYNGSVLIGMVTGSGTTAIHQLFSYDASGNVVSVDYSSNGGSTFTTYYYLRNGQGDITKLIDGSGNTVVQYTYETSFRVDSWGKLIATTGTLASTLGQNQPFRYRAYVYDTETGWYYLQSRYYNPTTCRFISADVVMSTGQGVFGYNTFAYCLNNPLNSSDPSGFFSWGQLFACIAIVAVAAVAVVATVATAGAAGAAIGTAVGMYLGASAATVATTAVTVGAYAVATGIAVCAASDVGEVCTGTNVVRDYVYGGDQGVYDTVKSGLYITSALLCNIGASYNQYTDSLSDQTDTGAACFIAGTVILTHDGEKSIEAISEGDYVYATNPETGESGYKRVVQTFENETDELVKVTHNGETITTTPTHPFYSPQKGWTEAIKLRAGDILVTSNGEYVVVEKVQHELIESPVTVYNFEVEDFHTYYVVASTDAGHDDAFVLVHNRCGNSFDNFSTGRTEANNLNEQIAMKSVRSNPAGGSLIGTNLGDPRLPSGTVKMSQYVRWYNGGVDIHYLYNDKLGYFDFKFK